jgi:enoyl-CoA hydratase
MSPRTTYDDADGIATITLDDGKVNALSAAMLAEVSAQLDRAEASEEAKAVVLAGRERTLSAGFDLNTPAEGWPAMLVAGASLSLRLLSFPKPTVIACTGNAIAMGGFLLLSADHRVGSAGDGRIGLNEVAIGLTLPWFGIEIARHRLSRSWFDRCTITGVLLGPDEARGAGFLDEVVAPGALRGAARSAALTLAALAPEAHAATKLRVRREVIAGIQDGIARLDGDAREW